jgi:hypothetical protein
MLSLALWYALHKPMAKQVTKRRTAYRIVQVPIGTELLERIDVAAGHVAESRAAYIRGACERRLMTETVEELDRRYAEGYRRQPEKPAWGKLGAKLLARRLRQDAWLDR